MGMLYEDVDWEGFHDDSWFRVHDEGCSGGTISIVMGICKAARKLKQWALEAATYSEDVWIAPSWGKRPSLFPDLTPEEMDIKDSVVFEKANPENSAPLSAVVNRVDPGFWGGEYRRGLFDWGWVKHTDPVLDPDEFPEGYPYLCMEVQLCEVEVDPETGKVDVIQGAVANDVGKAFDPEALEQQQFGGFAMGYSRSAIEEQIYDPLNGVQLTDNLIGYPIALMNDCALAEPFLIETGQGYGPYGASGCGETPAAAAQCVVTTAIQNAIGKWVDMPHTPMRILKALGKV
jgi:CO/xanthine dehydrogenase Mo-binding subunit